MKNLITSFLLLALPLLANAYDALVDGIFYNLNVEEKTSEVTFENTNYNSYSGEVNIPEKFTYEGIEYSVTSIGDYAFYDCLHLLSINIPKSITSIGKSAFSNCNDLTSVYITDLEAWFKIAFSSYEFF